MWHVLHLTIYAVFAIHGVSAHQSFRIADLTRGFDVNNTDAEVLEFQKIEFKQPNCLYPGMCLRQIC